MKLTLALAFCLATAASAQTFTDPANLRGERVSPRDGRELPIDQGATGLQQLLRKLNTRASLMNIVAHPDDEDGGMLTLYSRGLGARVADLSLNRGEGGQNAMTADFEDALGLLRTQELLASDRYSGVDQFFGTQVDFGFSKTKSESFAKWGHDRVLYDVVRAIRLYRPLVLTSTWIGGVTDGHGQHQVSGQIAQEAFVAAGDPNVFPELTAEGILPWQPLKIYARVPMQSITPQGLFDYATGQYVPAEFHNYVTGETTTAPPSVDMVVHEGTKDPLLTYSAARTADLANQDAPNTVLSYIQFSRIGLGLQKSQIGPGVRTAPTGAFEVSYHLYGDLTCNASATLKPQALTQTTPPQNCHPERSPQDAAEGPASQPAAALPLDASTLNSQPNFFDGIDTTIEGIAALAPTPFVPLQTLLHDLSNRITAINQTFDPSKPDAIAPQLADALKSLDGVISVVQEFQLGAPYAKENILHELRIKRVQLNDALALSLRIQFSAKLTQADSSESPGQDGTPIEAYPAKATIAPSESGSMVRTALRLPTAQATDLGLSISLNGKEVITVSGVKESEGKHYSYLQGGELLNIPSGAKITRPYFTRANIEKPVYELVDQSLRNAPVTPSPLIATRTLEFNGTHFTVSAIVEGNLEDGAADETKQHQPISIVPPASISMLSSAQVFPNTSKSVFISLSAKPTDLEVGTVDAGFPKAWKIVPDTESKYSPAGFKQFELRAAPENRQPGTFRTAATLENYEVTEGYRPIGYGDLPRTNLYTPATTRIVPADLKLPEHHKIAYLPGTGDSIPEALASLQLNPTILTVADLTPENLKQYDTIILGVRTYNAHPDLHGGPTQALLEYARNGGNVLVQFQTTEFTADDAPYPLSLGDNEKVVDETAPVTLLIARSSQLKADSQTSPATILTTPNLLTPADFNGWNEERGHGFLSTWDSHYTPLLEVHDPGEPTEHILPQKPQRGGLISVQLGKGRWTYCAFALYRQLPEAVPGAFRLFANLINP